MYKAPSPTRSRGLGFRKERDDHPTMYIYISRLLHPITFWGIYCALKITPKCIGNEYLVICF